MTELKTLKDLDKKWTELVWENPEKNNLKETLKLVDVKELKQEAIKWLLSMYKIKPHPFYSANDFIREFFNITEEDLK